MDSVYRKNDSGEVDMERKKVLQFIHGFSMGGAEKLVSEYCLKMNKEKYDVSVLCFHRYHTPYEKILKDAGINVVYASDHIKNYDKIAFQYPGRLLMLIKRWLFLRKYLRTSKPDIIHFHMALSIYILASNLSKDIKMLRTVHNEPKKRWDNSIGRRIDFWATKKMVKKHHLQFITLHDEMRKEVNELFGVDNSLVLNNGIDFSVFEKALPKGVVREREGIPKDAYVIGHVGRFNTQKNHKLLVETFAEICKVNPKAFLLMIGNGSLRTDSEKRLKELGVEGKYKILSNRTDIPDLMNAMDKFVFPSNYEGLGIVLIEAQKIGLECIISHVVPAAASVSNLVKRVDLNASAVEWAKEIENFHVEEVEYFNIDEWDMKCVVHRLEDYYA